MPSDSDELDYDCETYPDRLGLRFPEWVLGYEVWREWVARLTDPEAFERFLQAMAALWARHRPAGALPGGVTRVFVSHKQQDRNEALRAAWIANDAGHRFWLDILDPQLIAGG